MRCCRMRRGSPCEDVGVIPLFWPKVYWASKENISYTANRGEDLMATLAGICEVTAPALRHRPRPPRRWRSSPTMSSCIGT